MKPTRQRQKTAVTVGALVASATMLAGCGASTGTTDVASGSFQRPIDMVVPFGSGGGADLVARAAGTAMATEIGVDVPVVNVEGATGSTGMTQMLASSPGDAMAILIQDTLTTVPAGGASFSMDEVQAVCRLQSMPSALFVKKGTYSSWEELAAAAKKAPGTLQVATVGTNSVDDIVLASLKQELGTSFRAVPFSEPTERYAALLGGHVDVLYEQLGDVREYLDSGQFVPLALSATEPVEGYEDVPTLTDLGLPDEVMLPQFRGIVVNSETPDETVAALSDACEKAFGTKKFKAFQEENFADADSFQDADEFQAFLDKQYGLIDRQLNAYHLGN